MATATSSALFLHCQVSQCALGSSVNLSLSRNPGVKFSQKAKSYALGVQCFQGQPRAPVAYSDSDDLCTVRPVSDLNVAETIVPKPLELPTSALAIADVIGTGFTALKKSDALKKSCTTASAEFFALCTEQLGLCQEIVGPSARFTLLRMAMSGGSFASVSSWSTPGPSGSAELEFPPLVPPVLTDSQKFEYLMKETASQKKETASLMKDHMKVREFTKIWCTRDLEICAGEIWKWSVRKHLGDGEISNGKYLWEASVQHFVLKAALDMGMTNEVHEMKEISRDCILARNDAAHFTTIKALDSAVLNSEKAIAMFPDLLESHPSQCKTISKYSRFKTFLKENFI